MAKQEQMGFKRLCEKYPDEAACHNQLWEMHWPSGFVCPRCGCTSSYEIPTRQRHQSKKCRYQVSVTSGTVMQRSHLPLTTWFWAIYLVTSDKRGYSASQLARQLELPYSTAWFQLHRIREAMVQKDTRYLLSGLVEKDDIYFGGPTPSDKRRRGTVNPNSSKCRWFRICGAKP